MTLVDFRNLENRVEKLLVFLFIIFFGVGERAGGRAVGKTHTYIRTHERMNENRSTCVWGLKFNPVKKEGDSERKQCSYAHHGVNSPFLKFLVSVHSLHPIGTFEHKQ